MTDNNARGLLQSLANPALRELHERQQAVDHAVAAAGVDVRTFWRPGPQLDTASVAPGNRLSPSRSTAGSCRPVLGGLINEYEHAA